MKRIKIFYDDWCPNCTRFMRIIKKLDWLNLVEFKELRSNNSYDGIDYEVAQKKMASKIDRKNWIYGYNSIFSIFLRIPVFWIILPLLFLFKISKLGNYLYNELAVKRTIIPIHCDENCKI